MAGNSTVYDVKVRYALDDRASKGASGMASGFDKASSSAMSLKGVLATIGGAAVLKKGYDALIGFNNEIDQMKIGLSTVMQMQLHLPFAKAKNEADKLFDVFQQMAKKSPATTKDFMEMANAIAPAVALAGGGPEKLAKLTQGGVIASMVLGVRSDVAALDIKQMLAGTVSTKDQLAQQLLGSQGIKHEDFNKMSGDKRAGLVEKMLSQDSLKTAADQFGESFKGQISTIQDTLQMALGNVGKPLMASITAEVKKMNTWIERHPKLIAEWGSKLSATIKGAFEFVKSVSGWLVDNKEILFAIGKTFLAFKGAQLGTNIFKNFVGGMSNLVEKMKGAGSTVASLFSGGGSGSVTGGFKGLVGILSGAGGVIPALGLMAGAVGIVTELLNTHAEDDKKARAAQIDINEAIGDIPEMMDRRQQLKDTLAGKGMMAGMSKDPMMRQRMETELEGINKNLFDPEKMGAAIQKIDEEARKHGGSGFRDSTKSMMSISDLPSMFDYEDQGKSKKVTEEVMRFMESFNHLTMDQRDSAFKAAFPEQYGITKQDTPEQSDPSAGWKAGSGKDINVTIQKIEVASEDPDRFVFGIAKLSENAAKHPTSSQHTVVGGF